MTEQMETAASSTIPQRMSSHCQQLGDSALWHRLIVLQPHKELVPDIQRRNKSFLVRTTLDSSSCALLTGTGRRTGAIRYSFQNYRLSSTRGAKTPVPEISSLDCHSSSYFKESR